MPGLHVRPVVQGQGCAAWCRRIHGHPGDSAAAGVALQNPALQAGLMRVASSLLLWRVDLDVVINAQDGDGSFSGEAQ